MSLTFKRNLPEEVSCPANWSGETRTNDVKPNYVVVLPDDEVNQITITISSGNWAAMQANMVSLLGEAGTGDARGNFAGGMIDGSGTPPDGATPPGESSP